MRNIFIKTIIVALLLVGCDDDDGNNSPIFDGNITGGPFTFCVNDGVADNVSGIAISEGSSGGSTSTWIVTDTDNMILSLPASTADVEAINFDTGDPGTRLIWYLSSNSSVVNLEVGQDLANLEGDFDLSQNAIEVNRNATGAVVLSGGPFAFCIDGNPDNVSRIGIDDGGASGSNESWIITDGAATILALPETLGDLEEFDFNEGDAGDRLIWNIRYEAGISGLTVGSDATAISGCFSLSNSIAVSRSVSEVSAATISGGPYSFCINDGDADNVSGLAIDVSEAVGTNSSWIITDDAGKILSLPSSIAEVEAIDFDEAGGSTRLIWNIRYEDGIFGLEVDQNATEMVGCFALSNALEVVRTESDNNAGTITGGPFNFVDDGTPDFVSDIELDDANVSGSNTTWVVTDNSGIILALPATLAELEAINFENINVGPECFIWHMSYEDSLVGLSVFNSVGDLGGCFALSNSIQVNKN